MNEYGRELLRDAALRGVKQIKYSFTDLKDGYCAMGVLAKAVDAKGLLVDTNFSVEDFKKDQKVLTETFDLHEDEFRCQICNSLQWSEWDYIEHLNDSHDLDFLAIANKL